MRLDDVIDNISSAVSEKQIQGIVHDFATNVGMDGAYLFVYNPDQGLTSIDYRPKEWLSHYDKQGYIHFDAIVHKTLTSRESFTWGQCVAEANLSKEQKMMLSQARDFGLKQGYNCVAVENEYTLSTCCYYNESVTDFSEAMRGKKLMMDVVGLAAQAKFSQLVAAKVERPKLSPRETECLTWAAKGKTNDEIGTILSISDNTVNGYIQSACGKLKVRSKIHGIVKALQLKLIFPL